MSSSISAVDHQRAVELLPWLVNGTLEGEPLRTVQTHLAQCEACRAEVAALRRLKGLLEQEKTDDEIDQRLALLHRRLGSEQPHRGGARSSKGEAGRGLAITNAGWSAAGWWRAAALVQLAAVVALGAWLAGARGVADHGGRAEYRLLSQPVSSEAARHPGMHLAVMFDEQCPQGQVARLLWSHGLTIVSGPSRQGVYEVALDAGDAQATLRALRANAWVKLAQPIKPVEGASR